MKRVLITGGAGFIGSNLAKRCVEEGWEVTITDDLSNGHEFFVPYGIKKFYKTDFVDHSILEKVRYGRFDVIFHLAAIPRVGYSVEYPVQTNDVNVSKTLLLMNQARDNVSRFVFASSSSVYGGVDVISGSTFESITKNPRSPYALQKSIIEDYLQVYNDLYGLESTSLRFFNVFGPNQLGSSPYACAVSSWLTAIKNGVPMRSDGTGEQSRDLCYIDNTVDACVLAAKTTTKLKGRRYNIACGERTTNNQILEFLMKRYPNASKIDAPWRPGDVMHTHANIERAKQELGYEPKVKVWNGIEKTIEWVEKTPEFLTLGLKK